MSQQDDELPRTRPRAVLSVSLAYLYLILCNWGLYYPVLRIMDFPGKTLVWLAIPVGYLLILFWYGFHAGRRKFLLLNLPFIAYVQVWFYESHVSKFLCHECEEDGSVINQGPDAGTLLIIASAVCLPVFAGFIAYFLTPPRKPKDWTLEE